MPSFAYAAYARLCCSQEPAAWLEAQQGPASRRVTGSCTGMRTHTCTSPRACGAPARGVRWLQPWDTSKGLRASAQLCFALLLCRFPLSTRSTPHASPPCHACCRSWDQQEWWVQLLTAADNKTGAATRYNKEAAGQPGMTPAARLAWCAAAAAAACWVHLLAAALAVEGWQ